MKLRCIILGCCLFLVTVAASAQEDFATIVGTVTDATGALVPTVKITVSNPAKGFTRFCASNSAGDYTAARIPLGDYTVTAEATGFQTLVRSGITLDAGQTLRLDLRLEVGTSQQRVTVVGDVPKVETETGALSSVITSRQISELNIPARNFTNLALLIPGAAPGSTFTPFTPSGMYGDQYIAINGNPGTNLGWEYDGASTSDPSSGSDSLQVFMSMEAIAEVKISTSNYSAEYARAGSAMIEAATKSGTSQFHGSAFEFVRNSALNANDWFLNQTIGGSAPKQPVKHNDFGFTFGGPFYIPGHYNTSKQKTFFFVSEEWRRDRIAPVIDTTVPTILERQGDFSECDPKSANYNVVVASGCVLPTNLATGTTYANDRVPVSPIATTLLNAFVPLPNNGVNRYTKSPGAPVNFREDSVRVDQNISTNLRLFGRFTQDRVVTTVIPAYYGNEYPTTEDIEKPPATNEVLNLTYSIRSNLVNALSFAYSGQHDGIQPTVHGIDSVSGSILYPTGLQIGSMFPAAASGITPLGKVLPGISVGGGGPGFYQAAGVPQVWWSSSPVLRDDAVWTRGKHTLKFGGYLRLARIDNTVAFGGGHTEGILGFSNSGPNNTGNAMANFFLGNLSSYTQVGRTINGQLVGGLPEGHWRMWDYEPYFQDDWRVTHRLTLNLGFRYYFVTPFADVTVPSNSSIFDQAQFNPSNEAQLNASGNLVPGTGATWLNYGNGLDACGVGGIPLSCTSVTHRTPSPRFGFAWDPTGSGKTSIRGGYGLVFDTGNAHVLSSGRNGTVPTVASLTASYVNNWGYPNVSPPGTLPVASTVSQPLLQHLPESNQYSLTVEHEFPGNNLVSVAYVGNQSRHLTRRRNLNQVLDGATTVNVPSLAGTTDCDASGNCNVQDALINTVDAPYFFAPFRGYNSIQQWEDSGISNYNSLQLSFRHPVGHGLTFQAVYTWAHQLDDLLGAGGSENSGNTVDDYHLSRWYGNSADNQAQVLTMNFVYRMPFFAHSTINLLRGALGGWQLGGIATFQTGNPIGLNCGIAGTASAVGGSVRCNSLGKVQVHKGTYDSPQFGPEVSWFDPSTIGQITLPQLYSNGEPGMFGYMGKFALTGPGRNDWDLSLIKNFQLPWFGKEPSTLQFRWETFNTFNHPQWNGVNLFCSSSTLAGQPCNGANNIGNGAVNSDWGPRTMQLGLRLVF